MWIAGTQLPGGFGSTGTLQWTPAEEDDFRVIPQPTYLNVTTERGKPVIYRQRMYICGFLTDNSVLDEELRLNRLGIQAPTSIPTIAAGAAPGPTATEVIGYVTFYDETTNERSSLSGGSDPLTLSNDSIDWSNLPTSSQDGDRVSHIELWRAVDGALPRQVARLQIGITSYNENVATLALGEAFITSFERFPRCKYNAMYHDRHYMAGDEENPDTIYASAAFLPERWEGLLFKTRNGEPVVGLLPVRDVLLVFCPNSTYAIQGYTETDATMNLVEPNLGALSHFMLENVDGNGIIPNHKSIYLYNGSFNNIMKDGQYEWRNVLSVQDNYDIMVDGYAAHDPVSNTYQISFGSPLFGNVVIPDVEFPSEVAPGTTKWVCDLNPLILQLEGQFSQANWSYTMRSRVDQISAVLALPGYGRVGFYTGSTDGKIRKENIAENGDDDEDLFQKQFYLVTPALLMGNPGGDIEEGKTLVRAWSYVMSETEDWVLRVIGGDEEAWRALQIVDNVDVWWMDQVPESFLTNSIGANSYDYTPKTVHNHIPDKVSGRAFTFSYYCNSPINFKFRGFGGLWVAGPAGRPPLSVTSGS